MSDIEFVNGLLVKAPHERAPDYVKASISIKRVELMEWLAGKSDEWINVVVKESKKGSWYAAVDNYKLKQENKPGANVPTKEYAPDFNDDIGF